MATEQPLEFTLNGRRVAATPRAGESLLEMLRERFGVTSIKDGCAPQGQCGCCLVLIDGQAKASCVMSAVSASGRGILTLEGLPAAERDLFARAFVAAAGVQCGFCIPGIAVRAKYLLDGHPNPTHANLLSHSVIRRGDVDRALASSAHVVTGTWQTQRVEHLCLEPESALAEPMPDGRLHLSTQGQGIFDDRRQVAAFLGLPEDRVFVELLPSGGAFGGKEDLSVQAQTALLARMTGRPVKLTLGREESIRLHPKRHPITLHFTAGCDGEGRLMAVRARMIGDGGSYASVSSRVLERAAGHACGPYRVPNVDVESKADG